jgi:fatty acid desaturase
MTDIKTDNSILFRWKRFRQTPSPKIRVFLLVFAIAYFALFLIFTIWYIREQSYTFSKFAMVLPMGTFSILFFVMFRVESKKLQALATEKTNSEKEDDS